MCAHGWELGGGWVCGEITLSSVLLCARTHTHTHMLTHAPLHFFPEMQLNFAPSNYWEYFPVSSPEEDEKAAGMQEKFKSEEEGSGCFSLYMAVPCSSGVLGVTPVS